MKDKMILRRFMSREEYERYMRGEVLHNDTDHYRAGEGGSTSKGFCFFTGPVEMWAHRLNGLVSFDVLLAVEFNGEDMEADVYASTGVYCDNPMAAYPKRKFCHEVCTTAYSRNTFRLVSADFSYASDPRFVPKADAMRIVARRMAEMMKDKELNIDKLSAK